MAQQVPTEGVLVVRVPVVVARAAALVVSVGRHQPRAVQVVVMVAVVVRRVLLGGPEKQGPLELFGPALLVHSRQLVQATRKE